MTDALGGAPAPAASEPVSSGAAIDVNPATSAPTPLGSQTPMREAEPAPKPEGPPKSAREALENRLQAQKPDAEKAAKTDAKLEPKDKGQSDKQPDRARGEHGHFAPKDGDKPITDPKEAPARAAEKVTERHAQQQQQAPAPQTAYREPPQRFDDVAKSEWEKVPESVRGAVHRTVREMTEGLEKYKADVAEFDTVRHYAEEAKKGGTSIKQVIDNVTGVERLLKADPEKGLTFLCDYLGVPLRQLAEKILGQPPDERANEVETKTRSLDQRLRQFEEREQQRALDAAAREVEDFAKDKPRFEHLAPRMAELLEKKVAKDYREAYEMADRLDPAAPSAQPDPKPLIPAHESAPAQTRTEAQPNPAGAKSITGAPAADQESARDAPSRSPRAALEKALRAQR